MTKERQFDIITVLYNGVIIPLSGKGVNLSENTFCDHISYKVVGEPARRCTVTGHKVYGIGHSVPLVLYSYEEFSVRSADVLLERDLTYRVFIQPLFSEAEQYGYPAGMAFA